MHQQEGKSETYHRQAYYFLLSLGFSNREIDVINALFYLRTNKDIASKLHIAPSTVKTHIEHIYLKANVHDKAAFIIWLYGKGFDRIISNNSTDNL